MTRRSRACHLLIAALLASAWGCSSPESEDPSVLLKGDTIGKVTQLQLREELKDFADRFASTVMATANEIQAVSPEPSTCVTAVYWQLFTIPNVQRSAVSQKPVAALVDIWSFCKQLQNFFENNEPFGEQTRLAREVSAQIEDDITRIAEETIPEKFLGQVESTIDKFVDENPIAGSFARRSTRPAMVRASGAKSLLWVTELPLAPFRLFMDEHARAIREFTLVADGLLTYAQTVPDMLRWELQLLFYDLEARPTTSAILTSFETSARGIQSLARVAEELPAELRQEITATLDEAEAKQAGLRETLKEIQATLATADETLASANTVAVTLEKTTDNWNEAGTRWEKAVGAADVLVSRFTEDGEAAESTPDEEEGGFDIKDYTETATRAEAAVARFQELTAEARDLLESGAASSLIDRVVWSGVLLIVVFFGALIAYRVVVVRVDRGRPPHGPVNEGTDTDRESRSERGRLGRGP